MEIAYVVKPRPDTGLWNAKIAIWLFLASEVMLFGGLFSAYVFLRIGAQPGMWPHGIMNVPVGTFNTILLITSSITAVFAWAAVKMRQFTKFRIYLGATILLGLAFLCIKLGYEYPQKFEHFGAYIKQGALAKYEPYLGNNYLASKGLAPRYEISGHVKEITIDTTDADPAALDALLKSHNIETVGPKNGDLETLEVKENRAAADYNAIVDVVKNAPGAITNPEEKDPKKIVRKPDSAAIASYTVAMDPVNAKPADPENDRAHFLYRGPTDKLATIQADDVQFASMFVPKHNTFLGIYYVITVLHALHIVGGLIVFIYFFLPAGASLYKTDPEHFTNRIEVSCIYWHFVDLVWMFAFPIFYLL